MIPRVELSKQLKTLISKHPSLSFDKESGKIQCSLSGHEMPGRADAVNSYVQGKKYLKLKARQEQNFEKYKPHLVPSSKKHHEHQLFCVLTLSHVNKTPAHVERHVNGAKFKRAMARWEECQRQGVEYKPPRGRRKAQDPDNIKGKKFGGDAEDEAGEISDADSLSDLYPAGDFKEDDNSENDDDIEEAPEAVNADVEEPDAVNEDNEEEPEDENDEDQENSDFEFEKMDTVSDTKAGGDNCTKVKSVSGGTPEPRGKKRPPQKPTNKKDKQKKKKQKTV